MKREGYAFFLTGSLVKKTIIQELVCISLVLQYTPSLVPKLHLGTHLSEAPKSGSQIQFGNQLKNFNTRLTPVCFPHYRSPAFGLSTAAIILVR